MKKKIIQEEDPVHLWFGLTYSNYLVLPRSILQSAPIQWQKKFVSLLDELDEMSEGLPGMPAGYTVKARDKKGRYYSDLYSQYDRGRRKLRLKSVNNSVNNRFKRLFSGLKKKV